MYVDLICNHCGIVYKSLKHKSANRKYCSIRCSKLGKILSKETREKISRRKTGKKRYKLVRLKIAKGRTGKKHDADTLQKMVEGLIGGFWYGNVRYTEPQYCVLWKDVNPRVHSFFNYKCVECGEPENGRSHIGHHVFYVKKACCWYNENGIYYTNLNAKDHKENDYCIGSNPNYFVILCSKCHGKTNGNFANRKKWADHFKELIDTQYNGKCYFTKEEMKTNLI
jgi:hypothetical protein